MKGRILLLGIGLALMSTAVTAADYDRGDVLAPSGVEYDLTIICEPAVYQVIALPNDGHVLKIVIAETADVLGEPTVKPVSA